MCGLRNLDAAALTLRKGFDVLYAHAHCDSRGAVFAAFAPSVQGGGVVR